MDCEAAREHIDAWALGALDVDDERALKAHLSTCAACTRLADEARETAASLALAVPLTASSATLKSRTMASAAVLSDIGRVRGGRWWPAAAAALLVASRGAFTWGALMQNRVDDLEGKNATMRNASMQQSSELADLRTQVVEAAVASDTVRSSLDAQNAVIDISLMPDVQRTDLAGTDAAPSANARCLWSRGAALGALVARNLPPAPHGSSYHMWIVYENEWVSAGAFEVDADGRGYLVMRRVWTQRPDLGEFGGFAVTLEPTQQPAQHSESLVLRSPAE